MSRRLVAILLAFVCLMPVPVSAASPDQRGLAITPPRQYLTATPNQPMRSSISIANLTDQPFDVQLSVEQFSVANFSYDYDFRPVTEKWITFETPQTTLKKTESRTVNYTVAVPQNAAPGGHYFMLVASTTLNDGRQMRAATVLYLTVQGDLQKQATLVKNSAPWVSFGGEIPFQFEAKVGGNTHFLAYVSGRRSGPWPSGATTTGAETAHLLLPNTTRAIQGKIDSPEWPGVYTLTYGYRDEDGRETYQSQPLVYAPWWSLSLLVGLLWLVVLVVRRLRRARH